MNVDDHETENNEDKKTINNGSLLNIEAQRHLFYELAGFISQAQLYPRQKGKAEFLSLDEIIGLMLVLSRPEDGP